MGHLRYWWQYLTGKPDESEAPPATTRPARPKPAQDGSHRADPGQRRGPRRVSEAGFDPYANDAGYSKPHTWDRIERK